MSLTPESLLLLQPEASVFTRPTFSHARTLVYGTRLSSGRRTVAAARRSMGRGNERHFTTCHRILNRAVWSPFHLSRILLGLLVIVFLQRSSERLVHVTSGTGCKTRGEQCFVFIPGLVETRGLGEPKRRRSREM